MAPNSSGKAPKKTGRPRSTPKRGRPTKAVAARKAREAERKSQNDTSVVGTPISSTPAPTSGSRAYQVAMGKISRAERFWGISAPRSDATMWQETTGAGETDEAFRARLSEGRSAPERATVTVDKALGEMGTAKTSANPTGFTTPPIRERPLPSLVGPDVPTFIGTHRAVPAGSLGSAFIPSSMSTPVDTGKPAEGPFLPPNGPWMVRFGESIGETGPASSLGGHKEHVRPGSRALIPPVVPDRPVAPSVHINLGGIPHPLAPQATIPAHLTSSQFRPRGDTQVTAPQDSREPRLIRSRRVQPEQAREEDADVYERLVHLNDSIRRMMEDTGTKEYHPSRGATSQPSGLVDLRGRVGDSTMKTWIDDDIKKDWEARQAAQQETTTHVDPRSIAHQRDEETVSPEEAQAAKEAALADMRAMTKKKKKSKD